MIVVFDASLLVYLLDDKARAPIDPTTGKPVADCGPRIQHLIATLQREKAKIIVPTPALAEVLVRGAKAAPDWLRILKSSKHFLVRPFDDRDAVEFAARQAARQQKSTPTRAKAKFDDQIVAIAAVEGAEIIYSDDDDIRRAAGAGLKVVGIAELPVPMPAAQLKLELAEPPPEDDQPPVDEEEPNGGRTPAGS